MRRVQARLRDRVCVRGSTLLRQDEVPDALYILRSGSLSVDLETPGGASRHLARVLPGESVGEMGLLTGEPAAANVTAIVDSELWQLQQADFFELLATCPALARNVAHIASRRLARIDRGPQTALKHLMVVRAHAATPVGVVEELVRSVAWHLSAPLLVLDHRRTRAWHQDELAPSVAYLASQEAETPRQAQPMVVSLSELAGEAWERIERSVPGWLRHVLLVTDSDRSLAEYEHVQGSIQVDVCLVPEFRAELPPDAADVVIITATPRSNSLSARRESSARCGGRVIGFLTLTPGGAAAADQVAWLARHLAQLKVGLALGAGGARGFAHFGVLRGLQRLGVPVDYVVGTSVGSIVAAGVASGTNVEDMIEDMATASAGSVRRTLSRHSLLSNRGLIGALRETVGDVRIENLPLPFAAVAVDLLRHTEVVLSEGFALAVRARVERDTRCLSTRVD